MIRLSSQLQATLCGVVGTRSLQQYMLPGQYDALSNPGHRRTFHSASKSRQDLITNWLTHGQNIEDNGNLIFTNQTSCISVCLSCQGVLIPLLFNLNFVEGLYQHFLYYMCMS